VADVWNDFFVAVAAASAALAGLLFVAISINLSRILEFPHLPARGFESLAVLITVLLVALFALVPGQPALALGLELALTGFASWGLQTYALVRHWSAPGARTRHPVRVLMNQLPSPPLMIAGVLLSQHDASGAYWIVPAVVLAFLTGILGAWVILVEIQR
jgi:hypothetical protein